MNTLRDTGVRLPDELAIDLTTPLTVTYAWVDGPTLAEAVTTNPGLVVESVREISGWVRALDGTDARIDTNLANFCLADGAPILVDVLPPLIVSTRPVARDLFEELLDGLCFDTPVTLDALAAYSLTRLLTGGPAGWAAASALSDVTHDLLAAPRHHGLAGSWFRARLILAARCAAGQSGLAELRAFSRATSVLSFHRLDEQARRERAAQVQRLIHDLGLEDA